MASVSFLTRIIQNARPEAEWLADESYQLSPNQSVEAYTVKEVQVDGNTQQMLFLRSKTNTTNGKRLFKELPYNDEYLMYMLQDNIDAAVTNLNTEITTVKTDITNLETRMDDAEGDISNLTSSVTTISGAITNINGEITTINGDITKLESDLKDEIDQAITSTYKPMGSISDISALPAPSAEVLGEVYNVANSFTTTADFLEGAGITVPAGSNVAIVDDGTGSYKYDVIGSFVDLTNYYTKSEVNDYVEEAMGNIDTSAIETDIDNLQSDVSNLTSGLNTVSGSLTTIQGTADSALQKSGGTMTGDLILASTPTAGNSTKTAATTEFVTNALANFSSGTEIILSATAPTNAKTGTIWLKEV